MKLGKKIILVTTAFVVITSVIFVIAILDAMPAEDGSKEMAQIRQSIDDYIRQNFPNTNISVKTVVWNEHDQFMRSSKYFAICEDESNMGFYIFVNKQNQAVFDNYNERLWNRELNDSFTEIAKKVFSKDATCNFTFTFDYTKSSGYIQDLMLISNFNESIDFREELCLDIAPYEKFLLLESKEKMQEVVAYLQQLGINYGKVNFNFSEYEVVTFTFVE